MCTPPPPQLFKINLNLKPVKLVIFHEIRPVYIGLEYFYFHIKNLIPWSFILIPIFSFYSLFQ